MTAPKVVPLQRPDVPAETLAFRRVLAETGLWGGGVFDLPLICEQASTVACPLCHRAPGVPCTEGARRRGWHVARFGRACKQHVITGPELIAVLHETGVFTPATVVVEDGGA